MLDTLSNEYTLSQVTWRQQSNELLTVRQHVLGHADYDESDHLATHWLAIKCATGAPVGAVRIDPHQQHIDWLGVIAEERQCGLGSGLLATALRSATESTPITLYLPTSLQDFLYHQGFQAITSPQDRDTARPDYKTFVLATPDNFIAADLRSRSLGADAGRLIVNGLPATVAAIAALVSQAQHHFYIFTPDLNPALYDQDALRTHCRRLAIARAGQIPIRILLMNADLLIKRGQRLLELMRCLSSDIQILTVADEDQPNQDSLITIDSCGYARTTPDHVNSFIVDFHDRTETRRLERSFNTLWQRGQPHQQLRRLYL
jgi:predicted GNAT family N-acyltransferase